MRKLARAAALAGAGGALYALIVRGYLTLDVGVGRAIQPLGPLVRHIEAPVEVVFDVIAAPYLERTPRALEEKLQVWERGSDMVLAAHHTPLRGGLTATTLETVRFTRPTRIDFRLVRGPVPHVAESFRLRPLGAGSELTWSGELGTDFWALGRLWGQRVARVWERAVRDSFEAIAAEAERRAAPRGG